MATYPVLLDARPAYLGDSEWPRSLLLTPLGRATLLNHWLTALTAVSSECPVVLVPFAASAAYQAAIQAAAGRELAVLPGDEFACLVHTREPSDWLLLVDTAQFPVDSSDLAVQLKRRYGTASAIHLVSAASDGCDAHECVHLDDDGCVRRIQRYYEGVTWRVTCGICCSLVAVAAIETLRPVALANLAAFRQDLAREGTVARDICLEHGGTGLSVEHALLTLSESVIRKMSADAPGPFIAAGGTGEIHPTARLLGPVVVQEGVTIEAGAHVIGPSLIGAGARLGAGAAVAQSLVLPGTAVPSRAMIRGRVFSGADRRVRPLEVVRRAAPAPLSVPPDTPGAAIERGGSYVRVKRALDCFVALLGLVVLAPLLAIVAILIKLTSRGPVFFGHRREGLGGKEFCCWKFRTMVADADVRQRALYQQNKVDGPQFKMENDPRITRIGRWLRATNIDELPQLINVVLGQMSLIGPRPSPFRENQICVPWRQARLSVRPGITGLWQICRHDREAGDFHQWIHFDMLYVRHLSLWLDLKILIGTLATLGGRWSVAPARMIPKRKLRGATAVPLRPDWVPLLPPLSATAPPSRAGNDPLPVEHVA
jgi:lipopolysaccharide/colanic/teichoic acid biosynthesis glycosyltransferase